MLFTAETDAIVICVAIVMLRFRCRFLLVLKMSFFVKATAKSFFDRLIRYKNTVLFKWCSFSSVTYVTGFCYDVVDFLRANSIARSEEDYL